MRQLAGIAALIMVSAGSANAGEIDPALSEILRRAPAADAAGVVSTLVYMSEQVNSAGLTDLLDAEGAKLATRNKEMVQALRTTAEATQPALLQRLETLKLAGRVIDVEPFWVGNIIRVDVPANDTTAITEIARRGDVQRVYFNFGIQGIHPVAAGDAGAGGGAIAGGVEPGVLAVRAPEVWALGFTGEGILVATLDTGVDGNHPALASRWRGLDPAYAGNPQWAFFDPVTNQTFPFDSASHGTHTMGSVCGGAPGDQVGVAPGAQWIHAAVIDRVSIAQTVSDAIAAYEWMLDPDGDPATSFDVPAVCSNSWGLTSGHGFPDCDQTFWSWLDACEAAGIVILFSAGNEGTSGLRRPSDRATDDYRTLAVAAVDGNTPSFPIASFSSRGPTNCTPGGTPAIKPDIAAPGVSVRSSVPGGGPGGRYALLSGTSMASPHVAGVVALIRQANPDLSVEQVKQILYDTAFDLGAAGEDNSYGWGMVDAFEAVQAALATITLTFSFPNGRPDFIEPTGGTTIRVVVSGQVEVPQPGSGLLHYSTGGPFTQVSMAQVQPNEYDAVFPSFACGATVNYYFSAETQAAEQVVNPPLAPATTYSGEAFSGTTVVFEDDFEADLGWVATNLGASSGDWQRGVPINDPGWAYDPLSDGDGSGQCWLTENLNNPAYPDPSNTDVDNGAVRLTSPFLDLTGGNVTVSYLYYLRMTNAAGVDRLLVEISSNGDIGPWTIIAVHATDGGTSWRSHEITQSQIEAVGVTLTANMKVRFTANDADPQSIVEAGVDAFQINQLLCCPWDCQTAPRSGSVDVPDLLALLGAWGGPQTPGTTCD
ncbi:MAG: S8 family serine peptidase, partial [Planctomycetes bacterium]|nr:S8 family serine peptidase [Planctomycetota bacterium]